MIFLWLFYIWNLHYSVFKNVSVSLSNLMLIYLWFNVMKLRINKDKSFNDTVCKHTVCTIVP